MDMHLSRPILLKKSIILYNNLLICTHCNQLGHDNQDCLLYEFEDMNNRKHQNYMEKIYYKSGIPEKYWKSEDPLKEFLMNNNIHGHRLRMYMERKNKRKHLSIQN